MNKQTLSYDEETRGKTVINHMGGVFLYNRPEQILEQYELEVKSISRGRDSYQCDTEQGPNILREYRGSKERAGFLADMLDHLSGQGRTVETVMRTKEGEPFSVNEEETKYILYQAFPGAECDTKNRADMLSAVRELALLHQSAQNYEGSVPEFLKSGQNNLLLLYEKRNRELNKVRNYIRAKKKKNDFEMMFSVWYPEYVKKAQETTDILKDLGIQEQLIGFCHGDYNQHNVIFSREGIAVVHFENFLYQESVGDLANFIRKMMEKNNWNAGLGMDLIRGYDRVRKLSPEELKYLYVYLAYPEKFWKIANRYYNSHKAWLSGRNIEKLEKVVAQEDAREQFLQMLFHFTV